MWNRLVRSVAEAVHADFAPTLRRRARFGACVAQEEEGSDWADACERVVCAFRAEREEEMARERFRATDRSRLHVQFGMVVNRCEYRQRFALLHCLI